MAPQDTSSGSITVPADSIRYDFLRPEPTQILYSVDRKSSDALGSFAGKTVNISVTDKDERLQLITWADLSQRSSHLSAYMEEVTPKLTLLVENLIDRHHTGNAGHNV